MVCAVFLCALLDFAGLAALLTVLFFLLDDGRDKACIPIIAMTANAFEEDKRKAIEAGMNDHIAKPIQVDKLLSTLKTILTENIIL